MLNPNPSYLFQNICINCGCCIGKQHTAIAMVTNVFLIVHIRRLVLCDLYKSVLNSTNGMEFETTTKLQSSDLLLLYFDSDNETQ